jgi:hypothetical protein
MGLAGDPEPVHRDVHRLGPAPEPVGRPRRRFGRARRRLSEPLRPSSEVARRARGRGGRLAASRKRLGRRRRPVVSRRKRVTPSRKRLVSSRKPVLPSRRPLAPETTRIAGSRRRLVAPRSDLDRGAVRVLASAIDSRCPMRRLRERPRAFVDVRTGIVHGATGFLGSRTGFVRVRTRLAQGAMGLVRLPAGRMTWLQVRVASENPPSGRDSSFESEGDRFLGGSARRGVARVGRSRSCTLRGAPLVDSPR